MRGLSGSPLAGEFTFETGSPLGVEIVEIKSRTPNLQIGELTELEAGKKWSLACSAKANSRPAIYKEKLEMNIKTSDGEDRTLNFLVSLNHRDRIVFQPKSNVKFLDKDTRSLLSDGSRPIERNILVTGGDQSVDFRVLDVRLDAGLAGIFNAEVVPVREGKSYKVKVTLDSYQNKKNVLGKLTIVTDDPLKPERTIWVMGQFFQKRETAQKGT